MPIRYTYIIEIDLPAVHNFAAIFNKRTKALQGRPTEDPVGLARTNAGDVKMAPVPNTREQLPIVQRRQARGQSGRTR
jgi:hypothetical protein